MGRDNQAAVTKSVLHKVTVVSVSLSLTVCRCRYIHTYVPPQRIMIKKVTNRANADTRTRIHTSKISIECKWLQCMSRLVMGTCQILKMYLNVYSTRHNDSTSIYTRLSNLNSVSPCCMQCPNPRGQFKRYFLPDL